MAGDWIKMRVNLRSHPKVVRIASALKVDRLQIVGGLHAVWSLFDEHSEDGRLLGYTPSALDQEIGFQGFSELLKAVDWLKSDGNDGLILPEFSTHNGASAKRRAQEADRKRQERAASADRPKDDREPSARDADKKRTREEKRREDKKKPPLPPDGGIAFEVFWNEHPRKVGKPKALAAFTAAVVTRGASPQDIVAGLRRHLPAWLAKKAAGEGDKIPHPTTWLNRDGWWDEVMPTGDSGATTAAEWHETRTGIEARGEQLGIGPWDEAAYAAGGYRQEDAFPAYRARVMAAHQGRAH